VITERERKNYSEKNWRQVQWVLGAEKEKEARYFEDMEEELNLSLKNIRSTEKALEKWKIKKIRIPRLPN